MARKPANRRPRARKGARKGKASDNTKVSVNSVFKLVQPWISQVPVSGNSGNYAFSTFSPINGTAVSVNQSSEFLIQAKMYDEFCVKSVKMTFRPNATENNFATGLGSGQSNLVHSYIDRDGGTPVAAAIDSVKAIQAYDSAKRTTILKSHSRTLKCKPFWIDTNYNVMNAPFVNVQPYTNAGLLQVCGFYAERLPFSAATTLGTITIQWNVAFRGKKSMNLTYEPLSGSIIMTPLSSYPHTPAGNPPLSEKDVLQLDQTLQVDASGNLQIVSNLNGETAVALSGEGN